MRTEAEIREEGFDFQNVHAAFCWSNLSKNFIRELVEYDQTYKTQLEQELLMDLNRYSVHASYFYQNMGYYISNGLAEQKQLINYVEQIYQLYKNQAEHEYQNQRVARWIDWDGRVIDQIVM